ncbi:hypothetical protein EN745_09265 [Mesorhizobium sp. M4A.F.Ca.ET.022.05.2.1]|uniref:hypothetical protein n=1 Tax=Mesorhizobium TaxID=68287 RepID=UPI000FCCDF5E|nr:MULTISPECIES: hypothetical protein [Mesorhizobium]RVC81592.1 hypothetical protein EN745_09265 [Mesorhizobium sp. M4A.F.Ca.ET.022.05.2.1]
MNSDFAAARAHLNEALNHLCGHDQVSRDSRLAIDLLIEAVITAEHCKQPAKVIEFRRTKNNGRAWQSQTRRER